MGSLRAAAGASSTVAAQPMSTKPVPVATSCSNFKGESWPRRTSRPHREMIRDGNSTRARAVCLPVLKSGVPFQLFLCASHRFPGSYSWHADWPKTREGTVSQKGFIPGSELDVQRQSNVKATFGPLRSGDRCVPSCTAAMSNRRR